jgi:hypothetical protein
MGGHCVYDNSYENVIIKNESIEIKKNISLLFNTLDN